MIDIESMDRDALIAEIRRLRGNGERRKCPCGGKPVVMGPITKKYWVECEDCQCGTDFCNTPEEAWAAWDRREGEEISKYQRVEGE